MSYNKRVLPNTGSDQIGQKLQNYGVKAHSYQYYSFPGTAYVVIHARRGTGTKCPLAATTQSWRTKERKNNVISRCTAATSVSYTTRPWVIH